MFILFKPYLYYEMDSLININTIRVRWFIIYFEGSDYNFQIIKYFFLEIFALSNRADADEMLFAKV